MKDGLCEEMFPIDNEGFEERYMLAIIDKTTGTSFVTIATSREEFGQVVSLLKKDRYQIGGVSLIPNYKDCAKLIKDLKEGKDNKPEGMHFGS